MLPACSRRKQFIFAAKNTQLIFFLYEAFAFLENIAMKRIEIFHDQLQNNEDKTLHFRH